ncbi:MAG: hypothetical protein HY237_14765 [Acidobacteria bacterium]|nr:hypothetical protein [Acidobacteriota bacterium]
MESLFWLLANRTAETQFIFNLFHLLLAGLTLLVLLHQLRAARGDGAEARNWLLPLGFLLLVFHFAVLTLYFGAGFFFRRELAWANFERLSHGLLACAFLVVVAGCVRAWAHGGRQPDRWILSGCAVVVGAVLLDILRTSPRLASSERPDSFAMFVPDVLVLLAVGLGLQAVGRGQIEGRFASLVALATVGLFLILSNVSLFLPRPMGVFLWNADQHVLSVSLFAFAWAAGERSRNLLDRIFVRLNLTFIVLASLIMLITAGMEKYQYLRLAEERSLNLAEFLRGHIVYYRERGESLEGIFRHSEVLRRVVVEFGTLPELREVNVYLDGQRASFRSTPDWEIKEEMVSLPGHDPPEAGARIANGFQMIRLPLGSGTSFRNRIEFLGTMDYINEYIGKYIILIYSLFTIMVGLASGIVGIIVNDADRRLRRQYAELQETHQQLAQAAKQASIGQLAGGMAHEINNPITSILSLASHLAEEKSAATLAPRQRKSLQVIAQQAERVSRIVGNLLTFARQSNLDLGRVDVTELLDTAITLVQYRLTDSAIRLRREMDADLPLVLGDAGRLAEVFVNLLNNAIDAMPTGGTLAVRAFPNPEPDSGVRAEVHDTGCGIPSEQLLRIFDPFFTTKEPGRGTGLGLSVSQGIVKDHGGQIWAESQPGAGTTLVVILPKGGEWR